MDQIIQWDETFSIQKSLFINMLTLVFMVLFSLAIPQFPFCSIMLQMNLNQYAGHILRLAFVIIPYIVILTNDISILYLWAITTGLLIILLTLHQIVLSINKNIITKMFYIDMLLATKLYYELISDYNLKMLIVSIAIISAFSFVNILPFNSFIEQILGLLESDADTVHEIDAVNEVYTVDEVNTEVDAEVDVEVNADVDAEDNHQDAIDELLREFNGRPLDDLQLKELFCDMYKTYYVQQGNLIEIIREVEAYDAEIGLKVYLIGQLSFDPVLTSRLQEIREHFESLGKYQHMPIYILYAQFTMSVFYLLNNCTFCIETVDDDV